jgi:hypothetical protein
VYVFVCVSACVGVVCVNVGVVTSFENASSSGSLPSSELEYISFGDCLFCFLAKLNLPSSLTRIAVVGRNLVFSL